MLCAGAIFFGPLAGAEPNPNPNDPRPIHPIARSQKDAFGPLDTRATWFLPWNRGDFAASDPLKWEGPLAPAEPQLERESEEGPDAEKAAGRDPMRSAEPHAGATLSERVRERAGTVRTKPVTAHATRTATEPASAAEKSGDAEPRHTPGLLAPNPSSTMSDEAHRRARLRDIARRLRDRG